MTNIDRPQYDPNWEARYAWAQERFETLSPIATVREVMAARDAMRQAFDAQFATVADLAEFRFAALKRKALDEGFMMAMKPLDPEADEEDVEAVWRKAVEQLNAAKRARARPALGQPEGLRAFKNPPPAPAHREFLSFDGAWGMPRCGVLVERGPSRMDICIFPLENGPNVCRNFEQLALLAVRRAFPVAGWAPGLLLKGVQFYSYVPWAYHNGDRELFSARDLRWSKGRFEEDRDRERLYESVPPLLAMYDERQKGPNLLMPFEGSA